MSDAQPDDAQILARIRELVDKEGELRDAGSRSTADDASNQASDQAADRDAGRVAERVAEEQRIEVALDRCWDLLRQRRARRAAGEDPSAAEARDAGTVESYLS